MKYSILSSGGKFIFEEGPWKGKTLYCDGEHYENGFLLDADTMEWGDDKPLSEEVKSALMQHLLSEGCKTGVGIAFKDHARISRPQ